MTNDKYEALVVQPASKRSSLMHAILWGGLDRTHEDGSTEKHANPFKRICCFVLLANIRRLLRSRLFTSGNKRDIQGGPEVRGQ